ncbi:MAG: DUF2202 domain-containing protein [Chitinophagaceae bacterium]|nr:DUF2202 domain-containing protein [Chitinophagaceae bacterium]
MKKVIFFMVTAFISISSFEQKNSTLNKEEMDAILYMREEEKLARDVYDLLFEKWGVNPFGNIRRSEQVHMDRMKTLINTYELEDPVDRNNDQRGLFVNAVLQEYYNELSAAGSTSLTEALKAGAKIEELDIKDLEERIKQTQRQDIISVYTYLKMASENHLRAFVRRLKMQDIIYEPVLLDKKEFDKIIESEHNRSGGMRWD